MDYTFILLLILIVLVLWNFNSTEHYDNELKNDNKVIHTDISIIKQIRKMLYDLDKLFNENGITYCMDGGTLLGAVRHHDVIPWDDDADLIMLECDQQKLLDLVPILNQMGYGFAEFWGGYKIYPLDGQTIIKPSDKDRKFDYKYPFTDIFLVKQYNNIYHFTNSYVREKWPKYYHNATNLFPLKRYIFHNFTLNGPNNAKPYLDKAYGSDWKTKAYKSYNHAIETSTNVINFDVHDAIEGFDNLKIHKPKLWIYWENKPGQNTPGYIKLCQKSIYRHCSDSFDIIQLNDKNIHYYLPELKNKPFNLDNLLIAQRVDYYRILLLHKYGGLYLDADTLVLKDPVEIINKLKEYDYVGFGCTGMKCRYGYGRPSNGIMASRPKGKLITNLLYNIESKLDKYNKSDKKWDYFDLGKLLIWEELDKLIKNDYKYYHFSNDHDGTRDANGQWVNTPILFSNKNLIYEHPEKLIFIVMYNSGMDEFKKMTERELLNADMNISKFFRQSLLN